MGALTNSKPPPKDPKIINSSYGGELSHRAGGGLGISPAGLVQRIPSLGQHRHPRC